MEGDQRSVPVPGVDVSKRKPDVAVLRDGKPKRKSIANQHAGCETLLQWLMVQGVDSTHACMDSTNVYGEALAEFLHDQGLTASIVKPTPIKGSAQSELARTKTDKTDAALIERFWAGIRSTPCVLHPLEIRQSQTLCGVLMP